MLHAGEGEFGLPDGLFSNSVIKSLLKVAECIKEVVGEENLSGL